MHHKPLGSSNTNKKYKIGEIKTQRTQRKILCELFGKNSAKPAVKILI